MRARPIARIEIGIAASITCPTFSPEYADATVKMTQKRSPQTSERRWPPAARRRGHDGLVDLAGLERRVGVLGQRLRFGSVHRSFRPAFLGERAV